MNKRRHSRKWMFFLPLLVIFAYLLYLILGAAIPFSAHPTVSAEYRTTVYETKFTSEETGSDRVMLLEDNVTALSERIRMVSHAQKRIILSTFDFIADNSGTDMIALLLDAAERGVEIQILVDGASSMLHMGSQPEFIALAAQPNVEIRTYNPPNFLKPSTFNGRLHDKYLIVDDSLYILGGRNTYDYFLGDYPTEHQNLDRELLVWNTSEQVEDSSLSQLLDYFDSVWNLEECRPYYNDTSYLEKKSVQEAIAELENHAHDLRIDYYSSFQDVDYQDCTVSTNQITLLYNPIHTGVKEPQVLYALTELMKEGTESVILHTPYAICSEEMYTSLAKISETVPSFEMVVNGVENGGNLPASSDYLRNKGKLLDTGVSLWEYFGGNSYHGKTIVIDDELSIVGSFNWDMRSAYLDTELMLVVDSKELNTQLREKMEVIRTDSLLCVDEDSYQGSLDIPMPELTTGQQRMLSLFRVLTAPVRFLL